MSITLPTDAATRLRDALGDRVALAGDAEYDLARGAWNTAVDQRPFAVVRPESAEEVVDVVRAATAAGLRIAPQSTGHGAGALADNDLSDVVLVSLARLRGVTVNPDAQTTRVLGGTQWNDVVVEAARFGLAAPHGSAGGVSVAGYSLSGGLSFYGRAYGLAVNRIREVHLVTADGSLVTASAAENPDLFWAVRGGSGAFGVVVSLEIELLTFADVFAGMLLWDAARAAEVSAAWAAWTAGAPESATTSLRIMHFPPIPELPPFLQGRSVVVVDGAILEADAEASALLEPLRALAPEIDTFARIPAPGLVAVHMDPPEPSPAYSTHRVLSGFPGEAAETFVAAAMQSRPMISEIRHIGGAFRRRPAGGGAVACLPGEYLVNAIAMVPDPALLAPASAAANAVADAFAPWRSDAMALTFVDAGGDDRRVGFGAAADRLAELKRAFDPGGVFVAAHSVA